jgi:chromosome segregation ATPase
MNSNKEKIIAVAEKLEAQGVNPTQVTVREALGGGSFATIGPVLKEWKESKKENRALTEIQVPEVIIERLEQLQGAVWQAAVDEAERRLVVEREALKAAQDQVLAEVAEQRESVAALESEAEVFQAKIADLEASAEAHTITLHNVSSELSAVRELARTDKYVAAEALLKEINRADAAVERAQRAEALHDAAQRQSREDRDAAAKSAHEDREALKLEHEAVTAALKIEIESARAAAVAEVKKAEDAEQKALSRAIQSEKEAQKLVASELAFQSRLETAQRDVEKAQSCVVTLEEKFEKAIQEAAELRGELKALRSMNNSKKPG